MAQRIQVVGNGVFPAAKPVSFEQLTSGQEDSQFVEIRGIARSVQTDTFTNYFSIEIATGEGRVTAFAMDQPTGPAADLVDTTPTNPLSPVACKRAPVRLPSGINP